VRNRCFATVIVLTFLIGNTSVQGQGWLWAKAMGGVSDARGFSVAADDSGNVYTTGYFSETVDFDPGSGVFNITSGRPACFISKLNSAGDFVWAKAMKGPSGYCYGLSIALDASGNIYIAGYFSGTVDFNPGAGLFNLSATGTEDIFICKLNSSGNFVWVRRMGGSGSGRSYSIAVDASGNIYSTGIFTGTVDFNPGAGIFNLTSAGGADIFISKTDSASNFVWTKQMGGTSYDYGQFIAVDAAANVYTTGWFSGTVDFDPGADAFNLTTAGSDDIFISRLDSSGSFAWAKSMGGSGDDEAYSIAVDAWGNVYATGDFQGTADFNRGAGGYYLNSNGGYDCFILKSDSAGNFKWAKALGGNDDDAGYSIAADAAGNVYTVGSFRETTDFDPGIDTVNLTPAGLDDAFILKMDSIGSFTWAKAIGGTSSDFCYSATVNASGNVYASGAFSSPGIAFDSVVAMNGNNTGTTYDIFIAKLDTLDAIGINEIAGNNQPVPYPNPFRNALIIKTAALMTLYDYTGKEVLRTKSNSAETVLNTEGIAAGLYLLRVESEWGVANYKVIKDHGR
jgi:hypothetical protein